jgi:hypothetical protein
MKSFIRTISVFAVFALVTGCFALAKERTERQSRQAVREVAEYNRQVEELNRARQKELEAEQECLKAMGEDLIARQQKELLQKAFVLGTRPQPVGDSRVLVIPAAQSTAEELLTITEDMSVMSYIFDEKLGHSHLFSAGGYAGYGDWVGYRGSGGYGGYGGRYFGLGSSATRSIYLDGYGALFMMKVDFPLSPPDEKPEEEKPEEGVDPVWQDAKRKIFEPEEGSKFRRRGPTREGRPEEKYEAEKVEALKRKLSKALKHAANIRHLKPDDQVILSVTGSGESGWVTASGRVTTKVQVVPESGQILVVKRGGDREEASIYSGPAQVQAAALASQMGLYSPTVMTIRAKKSDVDAFSKGELDFEKFRQKVQIFTH